MNIMDAVIILVLLAGAVIGFKRGIIRSVVTFAGTILVIILAYIFKSPLAGFLHTHLPFFNFQGITVINILLFEALAFLIIFVVLYTVLRGIIMFTRVIETILKYTVVLGIPSKILGALFGMLEKYIILFVLLFVFSQIPAMATVTDNSKLMPIIIERTPFLSKPVNRAFNSIKEIFSLTGNFTDVTNGSSQNLEALDILLRNNVIDPDTARKLIESDKLPVDAEQIIRDFEANTW